MLSMHLTPHLEPLYDKQFSAIYTDLSRTHHQDRPWTMERKSVTVLLTLLVSTSLILILMMLSPMHDSTLCSIR
jgi:hypothetical protein